MSPIKSPKTNSLDISSKEATHHTQLCVDKPRKFDQWTAKYYVTLTCHKVFAFFYFSTVEEWSDLVCLTGNNWQLDGICFWALLSPPLIGQVMQMTVLWLTEVHCFHTTERLESALGDAQHLQAHSTLTESCGSVLSSQPSVTPAPGGLMPFPELLGNQEYVGALTCMQPNKTKQQQKTQTNKHMLQSNK